MILGHSDILSAVKEKGLIENFIHANLKGAGYDLRVGRIYKLKSGGLISVKDRRTPEVEEIIDKIYKLMPNEYVLLETVEKVIIPSNVIARILPRSSVFRSGCMLITAVVDPGFKGTLTMGIKNISEHPFELEKNSSIAQIVFEEVSGKTKLYSGRYQGGKVV